MTILVTGATGWIGSRVCEELLRSGYAVRALTRNIGSAQDRVPLPIEWLEWDSSSSLPANALNGIDGVIHLAGESVAGGRWSPERKQEILESRSRSTKLLCEAIALAAQPPKVWIAASAVGFYGDTGQTEVDESALAGQTFLSEVAQAWENASASLPVRRCVFRIGVVLGQAGGALRKLEPVFRAGLGGRVGNGRQFTSWVHMDDLVAMLLEALRSEKWNGVYNAVAPQAVTNREFTRELARALHRPALAPVPAIALKAALGEMAQVLLESQRVAPARLIAEGYSFRFPDLPSAFKNLFPGGDRVLEAKQWVPRPLEEVFPFFSEAKNLEELTPAFLNFRIQSISTPGIECGTRIRYQLRIRGVPATWVTHISDWSPPHSFVDEQESGPYSKWHHTHGFEPVAGGTLLTDRVVYRLPVGYLGDLAAGALVKRDVMQIFQYRKQKILERFAY